MSRFRRHKDASHPTVVSAFKAQGCSVLVIDCSAADAWDLEVGLLGKDHPVEVKPTLVKGRSIATTLPRPSQAKFFASWRGAPVQVVRTVDDVVKLTQLWRLEAANADRAAQLLKRELDAVLKAVNQ